MHGCCVPAVYQSSQRVCRGSWSVVAQSITHIRLYNASDVSCKKRFQSLYLPVEKSCHKKSFTSNFIIGRIKEEHFPHQTGPIRCDSDQIWYMEVKYFGPDTRKPPERYIQSPKKILHTSSSRPQSYWVCPLWPRTWYLAINVRTTTTTQ